MNYKKIEKAAEKLIDDLGLTAGPVPVHKIVAKHGLEVKPFDDLGDDVSGVLIRNGETAVIGYKSDESKVRQRFTIAHEFGHFIMNHNEEPVELHIDRKSHYSLYRDKKSATGQDNKEQEANAFAAALLMPSKFLVEQIKEQHLDLTDEDSLIKLAKQFDVSPLAMSYRIINLNLDKRFCDLVIKF